MLVHCRQRNPGRVGRGVAGTQQEGQPGAASVVENQGQQLEQDLFPSPFFTGSPVVLWEVLSAWPRCVIEGQAGSGRGTQLGAQQGLWATASGSQDHLGELTSRWGPCRLRRAQAHPLRCVLST